jgi:hypothetical protein
MVIDKVPYSCKFVNLLVDRHISPHFNVFVISLQVDLDFIAPTLAVKLNGRMAGSCAWQLRLGQVGWLNRGEKGRSWRRSFTSSSQTIRTSQKILFKL